MTRAKRDVPLVRACRTLGANMQRMRARAHLTQEAAAFRAGIHWRHWQKVEAATVNVCLSTIVDIAAALETDIPALFTPAR